ncbi:MAG: DNA (cytosine-5-)-methyltransferase [Sulfuritalea sp.]|nr:DNA (cytosine-5-)-methyltransferase [Sulfuritalea sp.]
MALVLVTGQANSARDYLLAARKSRTQADIAKQLGVSVRNLRRWELGEVEPPVYLVPALQQLLPLEIPLQGEPAFRFIDLFAGIGGIRTAFESIGGHCVFTSEWDAYAQKTYAKNNPDGHPIQGDITQMRADDVPPHDVLLAGFPCQPFSIAGVSKKNALGRAHGFKDETQGTLFFDICRIIEKKQPRAFLLENVKNLTSHDKGRTFDVIKRALTDDLGYHIHSRVIDGAHFVPQHRERILIVGFREAEAAAAFDWNALQLPAKGGKTLRDILHRTDGTEPELPWDEGKYFDHAKKCVLAKYTLTDHLWTYLQNYAAKHRAAGNGFGFGLVGPDNIARTLSARYYKDGSEILIDQGKRKSPRRLTPRECARLMGFPDTFEIPVSDTRAYKQFSVAAVVPMIEAAAKLMVSSLPKEGAVLAVTTADVPTKMASSGRWTKEHIKLAFHLYCQLPYGRIHGGNPEIIELARLIGRTPDAAAMKMLNIASLDPAITSTGRVALGHASALDNEVWDEFHADWEKLALECDALRRALAGKDQETKPIDHVQDEILVPDDFTGETRQVLTQQRVKQQFFRRAVLSSYRGRCCMSGVSEPRLLIASHIVPWSKDKTNRLNPSNGLCLSALHDRAFDAGLIALTDDFKILIADALQSRTDALIRTAILSLQGKAIEIPERFVPNAAFIARHRTEIFQQSHA